MQRAGLANGCLLPARLTKLSRFMHILIPSNFSDDLHTMIVRASDIASNVESNLLRLANNLVQETCLTHRTVGLATASNTSYKMT